MRSAELFTIISASWKDTMKSRRHVILSLSRDCIIALGSFWVVWHVMAVRRLIYLQINSLWRNLLFSILFGTLGCGFAVFPGHWLLRPLATGCRNPPSQVSPPPFWGCVVVSECVSSATGDAFVGRSHVVIGCRSEADPPFIPLISGRMSSTESNVVEQASCRPDSAKSTKSSHLSTKASPGAGYRNAPRVAANGVHDIEDRILRMTGYYGYYPGYSSHRSK